MGFGEYHDERQKLGLLASNRLVKHRIRSSDEEVMIFLKWQHSSLAIAKRCSKNVATGTRTYDPVYTISYFYPIETTLSSCYASAPNEFNIYFTAPILEIRL